MDLSILNSLPPRASVPDAAKSGDAKTRARASAEEFEAMYLSTMFKQMFAGLETNGPFFGGSAEQTWREMLVDQYGGMTAKAGGVGIADAVYREMLKIQEGASS